MRVTVRKLVSHNVPTAPCDAGDAACALAYNSGVVASKFKGEAFQLPGSRRLCFMCGHLVSGKTRVSADTPYNDNVLLYKPTPKTAVFYGIVRATTNIGVCVCARARVCVCVCVRVCVWMSGSYILNPKSRNQEQLRTMIFLPVGPALHGRKTGQHSRTM